MSAAPIQNMDIDGVSVGLLPPTYTQYAGQSSFFGGAHPLSLGVGYAVVLGFGVFFSVCTSLIIYLNQKFGSKRTMTSEQFNTAGRMIKTGLTAADIVSKWTWAATLLQSSNVAWKYGVSGPFWYASGATIQVLLFGVIAINLKKIAPSAHTVTEIVNARWGRSAHLTFLFFCFLANIIVSSMLLLGGAATVEALTGMDYRLASFLIPWGVILYTAFGGLQATFLASYFHTNIIFAILIIMIFLVYVKIYSSDQIYDYLQNTVSKTPEQCEAIFSYGNGTSFYEEGMYACGPVNGNRDGSYLTMISSGGLMFGVINIVGNFGTVFVDQSYWQSAIAARPTAAAKGYLLGGICWFSIPFSLATSLGLASTALMLPITASEAGDGLVPPAVATYLLGKAGGSLVLIMLFMAIVSTGSAEAIAVSSLVAYDIYREYMNPAATGDQILFVSRVVIVVFCLLMGVLSILLHAIGVNLGWVYLFMGVAIGSAVFPLWNLMNWKKASGTGAIVAAWVGFILALVGWLIGAQVQSGTISVDSLGTDQVMLSGNLIAIIASGVIHYLWSMFIDNKDYVLSDIEKNIKFVDETDRWYTQDEQNVKLIDAADRWIKRRGYVLSIVLIIVWPVLSIPAGVFTKAYFAFWVLVAIAWGFGASLTMLILPLSESSEDIFNVINGLTLAGFGVEVFGKSDSDYDVTPTKEIKEDVTEPHRKLDEASVESEPKKDTEEEMHQDHEIEA